MRQEKLYGSGEFDQMRRQFDGTGEVVYGSGEFDWMGQEKLTRWDRRSCIWARRV
jgi:hypothetical protein